jgi:hypothetical protein
VWPVSDEFRAAVRGSHQVVVRAEVWIEDARVAEIYPTDGTVSIDSRRATRRTMSMTVADADGTLVPGPTGTTGIITTFGSEIRLFRGVRYVDGTEELAPLGVFLVTALTVTETQTGRDISLSGSDRSIRIARNRLADPYRIDSGTPVEDAIGDLLRNRWADVEVDLPATGRTTGTRTFGAGAESDPWKSATDIAEAFGYDLAFDADGVARMRVVPDPSEDDPADIYRDGDEAVLLEVSRAFNNETTYNGVIASSEASDVETPVRGEAWDEDPNSPTYRYGPFGEVPRFYTSSQITNGEQAATVAQSQLQRELGRAEAVEWSQVVNPAHDVLDVVRIVRPASRLDSVILIDRLEVPLDPAAAMRGTARVREA